MTTQAALEAACVLITLMASPTCPRVLIQEELVEVVCSLLKVQIRANLLAFCDASIRREVRSDWESLPPCCKCASHRPSDPGFVISS
jgi:hypothetical protein